MKCKWLENDLRYITDYIESPKKMENAYDILHTAHRHTDTKYGTKSNNKGIET